MEKEMLSYFIAKRVFSAVGSISSATEKMSSYDHLLHIISAQLSELGITLGQVSMVGKNVQQNLNMLHKDALKIGRPLNE